MTTGNRMLTTHRGRPQLRKPRRGAFTKAKQERFFAELAATCNVTLSARKARIHRTTVYEHRLKSAEFRARWAAAVREAYAALELMMLERGMNGTVKTITRADGAVQRIHEYPNAMALQLLRMHRQTAAEAEEIHDPEDIEEVRARIAKKLERLRKRIAKGEGGGSDAAAA
ncbi:MAG TPA: hypothetical protein VN231_08805 [Allosphingosinicella sp.]|nr:hypothetical protein [Allosphingosinicella sp.]